MGPGNVKTDEELDECESELTRSNPIFCFILSDVHHPADSAASEAAAQWPSRRDVWGRTRFICPL
jgi:hypothetical protein